MHIIQWSEKFSTANPEIDTQHKKLHKAFTREIDGMITDGKMLLVKNSMKNYLRCSGGL